MFSGFRPIRPLPEEDVEYLSDEQRYWNRLKEVSVFQESGNITNVDFMPVNPYYLAASCFNRLTIYDTIVSEPIATFSRFKSSISSIAYRPDGSLLGGATEAGEVQFFNVHKHQFSKEGRALKNPIRSFYNAHKAKINTLTYEAPGFVRFVSMGDDGLAKLWDLADTRADNSEAIWRCVAHPGKKILTGVFSRSNSHLLITGSDDNTIRLWDTRTKGGKESASILEMEHGGSVNKVLLFQNDSICVSAGATTVKLWDITAGGKLLHTFENHTKNVTSLSFASNQKCILTAGLDRRIHSFSCDSGDFALIKSWKTAAPVLSLVMSADDQCMAYGMSNLLSIHHRKGESEFSTNAFDSTEDNSNLGNKNLTNLNNEEGVLLKYGKRKPFNQIYVLPDELEEKRKRGFGASTVKQRERGTVDEPKTVELSARHLDKMSLGSLDYMLRGKRYREMLLTMVNKDLLTQNPAIVVSAFQQIRIRQKLQQALSGHTSEELAPLVTFISLNLFRTTFFDILCEVVNVFLTLYAEENLSSDVRKSINSLRNTIQSEIALQRLIGKTYGILNMLIGTTQNPAKRRPISSSTLPLNGFSTMDSDAGEDYKPKMIDASPLKNLFTIQWKL